MDQVTQRHLEEQSRRLEEVRNHLNQHGDDQARDPSRDLEAIKSIVDGPSAGKEVLRKSHQQMPLL